MVEPQVTCSLNLLSSHHGTIELANCSVGRTYQKRFESFAIAVRSKKKDAITNNVMPRLIYIPMRLSEYLSALVIHLSDIPPNRYGQQIRARVLIGNQHMEHLLVCTLMMIQLGCNREPFRYVCYSDIVAFSGIHTMLYTHICIRIYIAFILQSRSIGTWRWRARLVASHHKAIYIMVNIDRIICNCTRFMRVNRISLVCAIVTLAAQARWLGSVCTYSYLMWPFARWFVFKFLIDPDESAFVSALRMHSKCLIPERDMSLDSSWK